MSGARLLRALATSARAAGCQAEFSVAATRDWASATFTGARYDVAAVVVRDEAAELWITALPDAELPMPRQFASEVRVIARSDIATETIVTIEALVLDD